LIKNDHFLLILGPKHDFLKRPSNRRIFTRFLRYFWVYTVTGTQKKLVLGFDLGSQKIQNPNPNPDPKTQNTQDPDPNPDPKYQIFWV
jgi:hypothetical protein